MKKFIILFVFIFSGFVLGQNKNTVEVYTLSPPSFKGGKIKLEKYIFESLNSKRFKKKGLLIHLILSIDSNGKVTQAKVESNDEKVNEKIKVLLLKNEVLWIPAKVNDITNVEGIFDNEIFIDYTDYLLYSK